MPERFGSLFRAAVGFFVVTLWFLISPGLLCAQDDEGLGDAAHRAGQPRAAFAHYMTAWQRTIQKGSADETLRMKIISVSRELQPPPEIPAEARQAVAEAAAKAKLATAPSDFAEAAKSFERATHLAPWNADYYYNLGSMQKAAGQLQDAINSLRLYLVAAPGARDARGVQDVIALLEAEVKAGASRKQLLRFMNNAWVSLNPIAINSQQDNRRTFKAEVNVSSAGEADVSLSLNYYYTGVSGPFKFRGALEGGRVNAKLVGPGLQPADGGSLTLTKAGGLLRATVKFTWHNEAFYYDDFLAP